jgi:hypothetical protein
MYKLSKNTRGDIVITHVETKSSFLESLDNTDYQAYLKWLEEGNTPEDAD